MREVNQLELMVGWVDAFVVAGLTKVIIRTLLTNSAGQRSEWVISDSKGLLCALVTGSHEVLHLTTIANGSYMAVWTQALFHSVVNREGIVVVAQCLVSEVLARSTVFVKLILPYIGSNQLRDVHHEI